MADLLKQSLNILKKGSDDFVANYTSNWTNIKNEAKTIQANIQGSASSTASTYNSIMRNGVGRFAMDWFYQKTSEYDSSDDEFDNGDPNNNDDNYSDADALRDATNAQMAALYGSGSKIAEVNTANTAEIVSTTNQRAAEIVASINSVNTTLSKISSQFDTFMKYHASVQNALQMERKSNSGMSNIANYDGSISASSVFNMASSNIKNNASILSLAGTMLQSEGPAGLVTMGLEALAGKIKVPGSNGKTINSIGESFNNAVGAITHNVLSELIETQEFKKLFGDMTKMSAKQNFTTIATNQYNTKPAVFDGITRYSIINVIPEYLKKINEALSGKTYNVNNQGQLIEGSRPNDFGKVMQGTYQSSGLSISATKSIVDDTKAIDINISQDDIDTAGSALTMAYAMRMYNTGRTNLPPSSLSTDDIAIITAATKTLVNATGKGTDYWTPVCMAILQRISTNQTDAAVFVKNVNVSLKRVMDDATNFAQTNPFAIKDTGVLTAAMGNEQFKKSYQDRHGKDSSPKILDSSLGNKSSSQSSFTMIDYLRGTFDILNRGINVRVTNDYTSDTSGFDSFMLRHDDNGAPRMSSKIVNTAGDDTDIDDTASYAEKLRNKMIPKSIRMSMQYFGNAFNNTKGLVGEVKDKFNTAAEKNNGDNLLGSVKNLVQPTVDKVASLSNNISNKLFGNEITDLEGNIARAGGGLIDRAKGTGFGIVGKAKSIVKTGIDNHNAKRDYNNLQKEVNSGKNISTSDQVKAQQVFALMQTATADGDTTEDISAITGIINTIEDSSLKSQLASSVTGMLKRSDSIESVKSSKFGKIALLVIAGIKKVISPIVRVIKSGITIIKAFGKKILSFLGGQIKNGAIRMGVGVKSVASGLFGQREKRDTDGNITQEKEKGLIRTVLGADFKVIQLGMKGIQKALNFASKLYKSAASVLSSIGKKVSSLYKEHLQPFLSKIGNSVKGFMSNKFGKSSDKTSDGSSNKKGFLSGFTGVFKEANDAIKKANETKEKKRLSKLEITTVADREASETNKMILGKTKSVFTDIRDKLQDIWQKQTGAKTATVNNETSPMVTENDGTSSDAKKSLRERASDKISGIKSTFSNIKENGIGNSIKGKIGSSAGGATSSVGKMLGGISVALGGLLQIVASAVMGLSGFKAIMKLIESSITTVIMPLNKVFKKIIKLMKPVLKMITGQLTTICDMVVGVAESIIDVIQPLIEVISPILNSLFETLKPILSMVTMLVKVILAPLMGIFKFVVVPILKHIGNTIEVISGAVQLGMGIIMTALGGILIGIGTIAKIFGGGSGLLDTGKQMGESGISMTKNGAASIASGIQKEIELAKNPFGDEEEEKEKTTTPTATTTTTETKTHTGGSAMDGVTGNGDVYNDDHSVINNIYGSGNPMNQKSYGNILNMSTRGCGPTALAEAYARRSGTSVSPLRVASSMSKHGTYNPNKGTSVGGFITASKTAGMNVSTGKVTPSSLRTASANNPVTIVGSGDDFGTKRGNTHYVNVIGTDKNSAYISNPLTGGISKRSLQSVTNNSILGLYGSGDEDDGFEFSDETKEAMANLKSIAQSILGIFTGDSDGEETNNIINAEKEKAATDNAKGILGSDKYATYEAAGYELFKKENPKRDGETEADYKARYEKVKDGYTTKAAQKDIAKQQTTALKATSSASSSIKSKSDAALAATVKAGEETEDTTSSSSNSNSSSSSGKVTLSSILKNGNNWDSYKNKTGMNKAIKAGFDAGMSGGELATVLSTAIWEDGAQKILGQKSLTNVTYDRNGQQAAGLMNWVDVDIAKNNPTLKDQLNFIHKTYFTKDTKDNRALVRTDDWGASAYKSATGKQFKLKGGDRYGPYIDTDPIEGSEQYFRKALVPGCLTTTEGVGKYVGTAVGAYNWMIDKGYIKVDNASSDKVGLRVQNAVNWAEKIANDDSHGYSQSNRWGPGDYDCSSLVISAYEQAGVPVKDNGATFTGNMHSVFTSNKCGFKDVTAKVNRSTGANIIAGDVLLNHANHAAMSIGDGKVVQASIDENGNISGGQVGDQTGKEIYTRSYYNYPWDVVLRYPESTSVVKLAGDSKLPETAASNITNVKKSMMGNGDVSDDFPQNDYLNNLYTNNSNDIFKVSDDSSDDSNMNNNIIPLDYSENNTTPIIINRKYEIKADDTASRERLKTILSNTFNVKSVRIEALLNKILDKMDKDIDISNKSSSSNNNNQKLFDDEKGIPVPVTKLSGG